jgi:hypothetical protein
MFRTSNVPNSLRLHVNKYHLNNEKIKSHKGCTNSVTKVAD